MRFAPFDIGKYPVTNAEYGAFIADDGYQDLTQWSSARARGWVSGDKTTLDEISAHWMETAYEHHAKEIRDGEIKEGRLKEECERRTAPRVEPYYWRDRRFNQANQPVVGVNYWEAVAFCNWATARGWGSEQLPKTSVVTLPTEFEWEHASRPVDDDRVFPWGDEWDDERAHVASNVLNMRQPTPVGIYLAPAKNAPAEMAGNVWEWTASLSRPYDDESVDFDRLDDDSLDERIVRGCSWYNPNHFLAACSARAVDRSYNLFYDVGFRVVVVDVAAGRSGCS